MDLSFFGLIPLHQRRRAEQPLTQAQKALSLALWPQRGASYVLNNLTQIPALIRAYGTFNAFLSATQLTVQQLLQAGVSVLQLLQAGVPVQQLLQAGVSVLQLLQAGVPVQQILQSGLSFEQAIQTAAPSDLFAASPQLYFELPSFNTQTYIFGFTGTDQSLQVGSYLRAWVKMWGAGGGPGSGYSAGGGGGYTEGWLRVDPGETLVVVVGGRGTLAGPSTYGGGGSGTTWVYGGFTYSIGSGGGRSAIRRGSTELATAGGGGGGGHSYYGEAGGGLSGLGPNPGTQTTGTPFQSNSIGGGGGWRGGGSLSGGSGYIGGLDYAGVTEAGSGTNPPRSSDPDCAGAGFASAYGRVIVVLSGLAQS